ncbi:DUF1616 domain-containing protein [Halostella sp. JP-L12]|uniref:DUF1616 domain-containing protein n=1 Tax=Halostella TaxID=1843185 RepID=UPI000EF7B1D4|nr:MULTISPECIES: DUF1616 domain-containing protein [Halostella]NHN49857.1 DUF1616 domain-containing protein [Halostella sp. JP-L12]
MTDGLTEKVPLDVPLLLLVIVGAALAVTSEIGPLQVLFGLPLLLFVPGYALTTVLFPSRPSKSDNTPLYDASPFSGGINVAERLAYSLGGTIVLVSTIAIALNFTPVGIEPVPLVAIVGVLSAVLLLVGAVRRGQIDRHRRYELPVGPAVASVLSGDFVRKPGREQLWTVMAVGALLVVLATGAYAVAEAPQEDPHTELYLLSENESGELVATNYTTEVGGDGELPLTVGVSNHEGEPVEYTAVVETQRVDFSDGNASVLETEELQRFQASVGQNESTRERLTLEPEMTGDDIRVAVLLYKGEPPEDPSMENAYRTVYLEISTE